MSAITTGVFLMAIFVWLQVFCGLGKAGAKACRKTIEWGKKED